MKNYLMENNISIYQLSKMTGISYSTVNDLANGRVEIDSCRLGVAKKIADALTLTLDDLYEICHSKRTVYSEKYRTQGEIRVANKSYRLLFRDGNTIIDKEIAPVNIINNMYIETAALWEMEDYLLEKEMRKNYELYIDAQKSTHNNH